MVLSGILPLLSAIYHYLDGQMDRIILHEEQDCWEDIKTQTSRVDELCLFCTRGFLGIQRKKFEMALFFYYILSLL